MKKGNNTNKRRESIKVSANCIYNLDIPFQRFVTLSGNPADDLLDKRLEKLGVENQRGRLLFEFGKQGRFEVECVYKGFGCRKFVTTANKEVTNMLSHKIRRKNIKRRRGRLVFEFDKEDKRSNINPESSHYPHAPDFVPCWQNT